MLHRSVDVVGAALFGNRRAGAWLKAQKNRAFGAVCSQSVFVWSSGKRLLGALLTGRGRFLD